MSLRKGDRLRAEVIEKVGPSEFIVSIEGKLLRVKDCSGAVNAIGSTIDVVLTADNQFQIYSEYKKKLDRFA